MPQPDPETLRSIVMSALCAIAPEVEPDSLQEGTPLRQQVDLDSMDWLRFLVTLSEQLHIDIPERDYALLVTLEDVVRYVGRQDARLLP